MLCVSAIMFVCVIGIMVAPIILHMPIFSLNEEEKKDIKKYGLIHFTDKDNAEEILKNGFQGYYSQMGFIEKQLGELIWFYPNTGKEKDLKEYYKTLTKTSKGKEEIESFGCYILVENIDGDMINCMKKRIGYKIKNKDKAIVYKGKSLFTTKMTIKKHSFFDEEEK